MNICISASDEQRSEIVQGGIADDVQIQWVDHTSVLLQSSADVLIDCTFSGTTLPFSNKPLFVHAPAHTLVDLQAKGKIARFCAWNSLLKRPIWEVVVDETADTKWCSDVMNKLGKKFFFVLDKPGLIAPRIICNIIYEAYKTLEEGVSTKEEIDLAMKLGTNYPYGPFEWEKKIGAGHVQEVLERLKVG